LSVPHGQGKHRKGILKEHCSSIHPALGCAGRQQVVLTEDTKTFRSYKTVLSGALLLVTVLDSAVPAPLAALACHPLNSVITI